MRVVLERRFRIRPVLRGNPDPVPEVKPLNDLLGLRADDRYEEWLRSFWGDESSAEALAQWRREGIPETLRDTVLQFSETGRLPYLLEPTSGKRLAREPGGIAYALEQIRYRGEGIHAGREIEVPSLAVLAAWALTRAVQREDIYPMACDNCHHLWFGRARTNERLCDRPFPGQTMTCRQKGVQDRFRRERLEWDRARRAAYARVARGAVDVRSFTRWRTANRPESFVQYDEWIRAGSPEAQEAARMDEELRRQRDEARVEAQKGEGDGNP